MQSLAWQDGDKTSLLVANLSGDESEVRIEDITDAEVWIIDETSFAPACDPRGLASEPMTAGSLRLLPYAVALVRGG